MYATTDLFLELQNIFKNLFPYMQMSKKNKHCSPHHGSSEELLPIKGHQSPRFQNGINDDVKQSLAVPDDNYVSQTVENINQKPISKPIAISDDEDDACEDSQLEYWIKELQLFNSDKKILESPTEWINSSIMDASQKLLACQFKSLGGFQSVGCGYSMTFQFKKTDFFRFRMMKNGIIG